MGDCAWDDTMRMDRGYCGGAVCAMVKKARNGAGDMDCVGGVCERHGDPLQFARW